MELRHIRYFVAAAEQLHFGRAADVLSVTRPAVSQTIADLETELGVKLFERVAQKVALTTAGETFLKHGRTILEDVSKAVQMTKRVGEGKLGLLTIGYGSLGLRHPLFREAIKQMGVRYPDTDLTLTETPSTTQMEEVRSGKIDAGFVYVAQDSPDSTMPIPHSDAIGELNSMVLEEGGIGIALPRDHPLAGSDGLDLADFEREGFIVVGPSMANAYFPFRPRIVQQVSNINTQINLISVGMGVGLVVVSPSLIYPDDIHVMPLRNINYHSQFRLIWQRGSQDPLLQNFVATVRELSADR